MVKKLFKHEILAYLRVIIPVQVILLVVSALGRFVQVFEDSSTAYSIVSISSIVAFVVAMIAAFGLTLLFAIIRFYRNLFTCEGYLSFTLPVTVSQHLLVKVVTAVLFQLATLAVMVLSAMIMTAGDVFTEICKAAAYLWKFVGDRIGWHLWAYLGESVLLVLVALLASFLLYYTCISIGQTARKNRVLAAVGVYFISYTISQVLGTALIIVINSLYDTAFMHSIIQFMEENPYETVHIGLIGATVLKLVLAAVYFLVSRWLLRRKLNLE